MVDYECGGGAGEGQEILWSGMNKTSWLAWVGGSWTWMGVVTCASMSCQPGSPSQSLVSHPHLGASPLGLFLEFTLIMFFA